MAPFGQQLVVTHLAGGLREIAVMTRVVDLLIGVFQPFRLLLGDASMTNSVIALDGTGSYQQPAGIAHSRR